MKIIVWDIVAAFLPPLYPVWALAAAEAFVVYLTLARDVGHVRRPAH